MNAALSIASQLSSQEFFFFFFPSTRALAVCNQLICLLRLSDAHSFQKGSEYTIHLVRKSLVELSLLSESCVLVLPAATPFLFMAPIRYMCILVYAEYTGTYKSQFSGPFRVGYVVLLLKESRS